MSEHRCEECGEEFDSERGLHIHQSQAHEDNEKENDSKKNNSQSSISLSARQFGGVAFALGLFIGLTLGGLGGAAAVGVIQDATPQDQTPENQPSDETNSPDSEQGTQENQNNRVDLSNLEMEGEPKLGESDAPVTMVVYEDFQCPFCKRFEQNTFPQIKENYVDSGKVQVIWKDYPVPQLGHEWAEPSAAAMECVYREGGDDAFWNVKSELFSQAKTLTRGENEFTTQNIQERIKKMADSEGVDSSSIQTCLDEGNPMEEVNSDKSEIQQIKGGGIGTPTIYINGREIVGAQPYSNFEAVIENELSQN
jgi:protein-disulfide isomerase